MHPNRSTDPEKILFIPAEDDDPVIAEARRLVLATGNARVSMLRRVLNLTPGRAKVIRDKLEAEGTLSVARAAFPDMKEAG
jgi:DNA segregation ATPase FtsK/SpoIIIE-like protein